MNYLVDTHIFVWSIVSSKKIPKKVRDLLLDPDNIKMVSAISFWEIALKYQLGKLDLKGTSPEQLPEIARRTGLEILNLDAEVAASFYKLPKLKNKDPFDRMLAWQAITKDYSLLTKDADFLSYHKYGLKTVW